MFKSIHFIFLEKILKILSTLIVNGCIAKNLGPESYGKVSYALMIISVAQVFSSFGLDKILVREISKKTNSIELHSLVFFVRFFAAIVAALMVLVYFSEKDFVLYLVVALILILHPFDVFDIVYQAKLLNAENSRYRIFAILSSFALKMLIIRATENIYILASMYTFEYIICAIIYYKKNTIKVPLSINFEIIREAVPYALNSLFAVLYMRMDQLFAPIFLNATEVGVYIAATQVASAMNIIPITIGAVALPSISRAHDAGRIFDSQVFKRFSVVMMSSVAIVFLGANILSSKVLELIYGNIFSEGDGYFFAHSFGFVFMSIGILLSWVYVNSRKSSVEIFKGLSGIFVAYFSCKFLGAHFGGVGLASAYSVTQFFSGFFVSAVFLKMSSK